MPKYSRNAAGRCVDENGKWTSEEKCVRSEAAQKRARKAKRAATAPKPAVRKTAPKKKPAVRKAAPKKKPAAKKPAAKKRPAKK